MGEPMDAVVAVCSPLLSCIFTARVVFWCCEGDDELVFCASKTCHRGAAR